MPASLAIAHTASKDAEPPAAATPLRRVLAFVRGWSIDRERPEDLSALRARLAGLGAELTVLADSGVWSEFSGSPSFSDRASGDDARTALLLGARTRGDMVHVIEGKRVSSYPHVASMSLSSTLAAALSSSPETT